MRRALLIAMLAAGLCAGSAPDAASGTQPPPRIVYTSDWSGTAQIYAVDPSGRLPTGQLTFGRAPACADNPTAPCGYRDPTPSPDGTKLLFWDFVAQLYLRRSLVVAKADGTGRHRVAITEGSIVEALWAPDSKRIAYRGNSGIHVVGADGKGDRLIPSTHAADHSLAWAPDGRSLAFVDPRLNELVVVTGFDRRVAVRGESVSGFAWSPVGQWIAFASRDERLVQLVRPDGTGRRMVGRGGFAWSPDGRLLALGGDGVRIHDVRTRVTRTITRGAAGALAWSPDGRLLAFHRKAGITLANARTGKTRLLSRDQGEGLAWSPDGRSLTYVHAEFGYRLGKEEFRTVGLDGRARTFVSAGGRYGGEIASPVWTRPPAGTRYRMPLTRRLATVSADGLTTPWPIARLAADGDRVAYVACGHVFVWTPSARRIEQAETTTSLSPWCSSRSYYDSFWIYALALTGERAVYGSVFGGNSRIWWLGSTVPGSPRRPVCELGAGTATGGGGPFRGEVFGEAVGAGPDLFYSSWTEEGPFGAIRTASQQVRAATAGACPGSSVASSDGGPLVPLDADSGRVVVAGDNETWVLDRTGAILTRVPEPLVASQLSGRDLVVLRTGELRHYDAATGQLLHRWPLPDVSTGRECAMPNLGRCPPSRLVLEDAARGLATYVLDGQVRVLRLADGADAGVAAGTLARFLDAGLVVADGPRLRLVPFDRLPLR